MTRTFVSADLHLWSRGVLRWGNRGFATPEEMVTAFVADTNARIYPKDTIYYLGDVVHSNNVSDYVTKLDAYIRQLQCKNVFIVPGNHDVRRALRAFNTVDPIFNLNYKGHHVVFSHFPLLAWDGSHNGTFHCHGHLHGAGDQILNQWLPQRRAKDVGVDATKPTTNNWAPVALDDVITELSKKAGRDPWDSRYQREDESI